MFDIFSVGPHLFLIVLALSAWKFIFFPSNSFRSSHWSALLWLVLMFACAWAVYLVLLNWSSPSVRSDDSEVSFYLVFCIVWIVLTQVVFAFLGISVRDDVAERGNGAAGFAVAGLTVAATCCAAGANIGDGPGFEVVIFCSALSTGCLLALWLLVELASGAADAVTIDRDLGTGVRIGGWLAGTGVVLGACVAGDWISLIATLKDFAKYSWPAVTFACGFATFEGTLSHRQYGRRPGKVLSFAMASLMVFAGVFYAKWIGGRG